MNSYLFIPYSATNSKITNSIISKYTKITHTNIILVCYAVIIYFFTQLSCLLLLNPMHVIDNIDSHNTIKTIITIIKHI
jgi:hypothetical protein